MATTHAAPEHRLREWLLQEDHPEVEGPHERAGQHPQHAWWRVMCLTGVDYFSTLGYQPGIAALAAGALAPIATLILVLLTLLGALPMYRRVAQESPHGEGSIAMLERLLPYWKGKLFVLCLLGFVATDFVITITLSAADATAHMLENPFVPPLLAGQRVGVTLLLVALLGAIFLKGFKEAIGIAVALVLTYLALNAVVVVVALAHVVQHPLVVDNWQRALFAEYHDPARMVLVALLLFPKLALGLSGFETGVAVMPLVRGAPGDTEAAPTGRIRNTRKLLLTAALIMSVFLIASSFATITLIPAEAFAPDGKANGRALAYLAHAYLGEWFGTAYDVSTICILWFAGASAMAGLLNIVPRYLPRYGMAPEWARAARPLVLVFTTIAFAVTLIFRADVDAQGGAYATGVLVLMSSAAVAVALAVWHHHQPRLAVVFGVIVFVFAYTTVVNVIERPDGVKIAAFFITAIVLVSFVSRLWRTTELRVTGVELDATARRFIEDEARRGVIRIIAHDPHVRTPQEYALKEREQRNASCIPAGEPVLFLEVRVRDPSEFAPVLHVSGEQVGPYRVLRADSASVPNAIAALLLFIRDQTGKLPSVYFAWSEGPPLQLLARFLLFGEGDIPPVTHEVLRQAEPDPARRPAVHVG
ncbi:MAG TPA: amino acid transporter [Chloroflexota bacterium]|nr:amino acid transporter [Chloroflexota bacterium]